MFYSLRTRLVATFILLLVLPFTAVVVFLSAVSNNFIGQSIESSTAQIMDQNAAFLNTLTTQVQDVASQVLSNKLTQQWISLHMRPDVREAERVVLDADMRSLLSSIALNHSVIASITLFDERGGAVGIRDQLFHDRSFLNEEWYRAFMSEGRRWTSAHQDPYQPRYLQEESVTSLVFPMVELKSFALFGVMKVNLLTSTIQEPLDQIHFGQSGRVYLLDWQGSPVLRQQTADPPSVWQARLDRVRSDPRPAGLISFPTESGPRLVFFRKLKVESWVLVGEVPERELFEQLTSIQNSLLQISGLILLAAIGAAFWLSSGIARPLSQLSQVMGHVERGDFDGARELLPAVSLVRQSEVGLLIVGFRHMVQRLRRLIETEFQANLHRRDAEYKALLMQINPHFMYNTLEVISSLAAQQRHTDVMDVTESLGRMLRFSLRLDTDLVRLGEELQYIRDYIGILRIRFGDRLDIQLNDQPQIPDTPVVKFILQPLVENAVKYSFRHAGRARVRIQVATVDQSVRIRVEDNGPGMPDALIAELTQPQGGDLAAMLRSPGKRIGLRNVIARCRLHYGERFAIALESAPGQGTAITLIIPVGGDDVDVPGAAGGR